MNNKIVQYNYQIKKEKQKKVLYIFLFCIFLFVFINLILSYLIYPIHQNSLSMSPDISVDSVVMVSPVLANYERGDIVLVKARTDESESISVFTKICSKIVSFFTLQRISLTENDKYPGTKQEIRRIIGMPGDTIYMRDYVTYVKPAGEKHFLTEFEITPKNYNVTFFIAPAGWDSALGVKGSFDEIKLGENEYFVLGDNRKSSDDSRLWGPVTDEKIDAKVILCYFPFKKIKLL